MIMQCYKNLTGDELFFYVTNWKDGHNYICYENAIDGGYDWEVWPHIYEISDYQITTVFNPDLVFLVVGYPYES